MTTPSYQQLQAEQLRRFHHWLRSEGGVEGPVQLDTYFKEHQQARLKWLKSACEGTVLEVGCSYGFVLAFVRGQVGIDINPANIELARVLAPGREFHVADATKLPFPPESFDLVLIPETLEHLDFPDGVKMAVREAVRVARKRVLITVPDGTPDEHGHVSEDASNFKHGWLLTPDFVGKFREWLPGCWIAHESGFVLIRYEKETK